MAKTWLPLCLWQSKSNYVKIQLYDSTFQELLWSYEMYRLNIGSDTISRGCRTEYCWFWSGQLHLETEVDSERLFDSSIVQFGRHNCVPLHRCWYKTHTEANMPYDVTYTVLNHHRRSPEINWGSLSVGCLGLTLSTHRHSRMIYLSVCSSSWPSLMRHIHSSALCASNVWTSAVPYKS